VTAVASRSRHPVVKAATRQPSVSRFRMARK
jgi:hypothetical protein